MKKSYLSFHKFYVFSPYVCSFIGSDYFSLNFGAIQRSKMADPRWPPFENHDVIATSHDVITSRCRPDRKLLWTYYPSSKFHCERFYTCKVMEGRGEPPAPEDKKHMAT